MSTLEIPQKNWSRFCRQLRESYRGAVSIRFLQSDGATREISQDAPFQNIWLQQQNECNDVVTIDFGTPEERPVQFQIIEPIRTVLRKNCESGRYKELEILAETGKTEIIFRPGIDAALLEKLAE